MYASRKAQSTLEYAVVIAIIVAGLIAMQTYIKRGVQGRLKQASDDIGEQFSPGETTSTYTTNTTATSTESTKGAKIADQIDNDAKVRSTSSSSQTQTKSGHEDVATFDKEKW